MADDTERLIVLLEAKIDAFEKNLQKASKTADTSFASIEARAKRSADTLAKSMEKAASGVVGVFQSNFLTAAGLGGLGLSALTAAAIKLNAELAKIPGLAREAGLSTDRLQEVKFAAAIKGVGDEEFTAGLRTSMALLEEAQRQVNSLSRLFNANGLSIRDQNGELIKFDALLVDAAKLMVNTRSEQSKIKIAEMVGLSREWVAVLRNGPEAFKQSAASAGDAGAVIDKDVIAKAKEFDVKWKEALVKFKAGFVSILADLGQAFGDFWDELINSVPGASWLRDKVLQWAGGLSGMTLPELENTLARSIEQGLSKFEIARLQAEIDRRLGKEPLKVTVTPELSGNETVIPKERERNKFEFAVFEANKRIAAVDAETRSIGLNSEARERAKLVAELEEAAKRANTEAGFQNATITDQQREKINQLADAMEAAAKRQRESHAELMRFAVEGMDATKQFDSAAISAFGNFENSFASFITGTKSAKDAFHDMATAILNDLTKMIIRMQITAPLAQALGGMFGAGAAGAVDLSTAGVGALGPALGAFVLHTGRGPGDPIGSSRMVDPAVFIGAPRFHAGVGPGEQAAIIRKDESVLTSGQMRALGGGLAGGAGPVTVVLNNAPAGTTATATSTRDASGGMRLEVFLTRHTDDTAAGLIDSGESGLNRSLERRYGLTPKL